MPDLSPPATIAGLSRATEVRRWLAANDPLPINEWVDPVLEVAGYSAVGLYVETYWLPTLGPTATWLYRQLSRAAAIAVTVDQRSLAAAVGLSDHTRLDGPFYRALARLERFELARVRREQFEVRPYAGPLNRGQLQRLPDFLQAMHAADLDRLARRPIGGGR